MTSPRHLVHFLALGLFWGTSPSLYKHLADIGMPLSHTIAVTGLGVGAAMYAITGLKSGRWHIPATMLRYGAACAFLLNLPFGLNLFLAGHVPPTELAIMITLSPLMSYGLALLTGWESPTPRRLLAIVVGLLSTVTLIVTRGDPLHGAISWWLLCALGIPLLYCFYNAFAARFWPKGANSLQAGAVESVFSGLFAIPAVAWIAVLWGDFGPPSAGYGIIALACLMWIVERISYFTLISEKGSVYTVQATYVATPAAVLIAAAFFGGAGDVWLWLSLALLMFALYLNNSGRAKG